ncbi:elongin-A3-like, partial [Perognathus longimembris pacificus]|uniref:elongin-A3-like n=1 Tax=Perognathus longimembris pacificus TaxID=214514 RepID=UPI002018F3CD
MWSEPLAGPEGTEGMCRGEGLRGGAVRREGQAEAYIRREAGRPDCFGRRPRKEAEEEEEAEASLAVATDQPTDRPTDQRRSAQSTASDLQHPGSQVSGPRISADVDGVGIGMGAAEWVCGAVRQLQQRLGSSTDADELRRSLRLLSRLPMTPEILAATGVRGTLEALSKHQQVGSVAKELAERWEILAVPSHPSEARSQVPERAAGSQVSGPGLCADLDLGGVGTQTAEWVWGAVGQLQERLAASTEGDALRKILRLLSVLPITAEILAATGEMANRWKTMALLGGNPALEAELMGRGPERDGAPAPSQEVLESRERKQKRKRWSLAGADPSSQSRAEEPRGPGYQAAEGAWGAARQLQERLSEWAEWEELMKEAGVVLESPERVPTSSEVKGDQAGKLVLVEAPDPAREEPTVPPEGEPTDFPGGPVDAAGGARTPRVLFELVPEPRPAAQHPSPGNGHSRTMAPGGTDRLWQVRCRKEFKEATPAPGESWQELFVRLRQEREQRLQAVSARIRAAQAQESGGRRAQMLLHPLPQKRPRR